MDEFEREALRRAALGDMEARREALALAADALRRGVDLSPELRAWLADALLPLLAAVESPGGADLDLPAALAPMGFEPNPAHRPADDGAHLRRLEAAAAVHVLAAARLPGVTKTAAVACVAQALPSSEWTVWRACKGVSEWPNLHGAERVAAPVFDRMRELCRRQPLAYCGEVRDFLQVTKEGRV
jgi:hypothetical protein